MSAAAATTASVRCVLLALAGALPLAAGPGATAARAAAPQITAPSAAVIEVSTGTVVFQKNASAERGMASTTKLMTALVALDEAPLGKVLTAVDYGGSPLETRLGLQGGEKLSVADLVRAMMLPSANDAAQTLAIRLGGSKSGFAKLMNAKAQELGLRHTRFQNSIGLDADGHHTSALDLAKIGAAAHETPFIAKTVAKARITLKDGRTIVNRNNVLGRELGGGAVIDGMKTGHTTSAGYSLVGSATRNGVTVVSAILGDPSEATRDADTVKLLRWASGLFQRRTLVETGQRVASVPVTDGQAEAVPAVIREDLRQVVPRGAEIVVEPADLAAGLEAPVAAGTAVGTARVRVNGRLADTVPLVTGGAVERQGTLAALAEGAGEHPAGVLIALALVFGGTLLLIRARRGSRPAPHPRQHASAPDVPERTTAP